MKKILIFIVIIFTQFYLSNAQDDKVSEKPEASAEKEFNFPDYKTVDLDNGLKIFLIESHEQPTFTMRLLIPGGNSLDTIKSGTADLTASLLTKGCEDYNADKLASTLDGMGLNLSMSAGTDYFAMTSSGLLKHFDKLLDIFIKTLTTPEFPKDELEKLKKQMISGLQQEKGDPRSLAAKLGDKVMYGERHPYSVYPTIETVKSIDKDDINKFYEKYFIPNKASLAIIGDFDTKEMAGKLKDAFADWKKGKDILIKLPKPEPMPWGVYFIERPGSVQSTINILFKGLHYGARDYDKLGLAGSVISGGISGRLFRILREKYSYTYSPYGSMSVNKYFGTYYCGADVKNPVTDSALNVTLDIIRSLSTQLPEEDEIMRVKNYKAGAYKMNYESAGFLAVIIQNSYFYDIPLDYMSAYPQRLLAFNKYDVKDVSEKYFNPEKAFIIVVGDPSVKDKLTKFGKLYEYNTDLQPLTGENAKMEEISMDAEELIENYIDAIGGLDKINSVQTLYDSVYTEMDNGETLMKGTLLQYQKAPANKYFIMDMSVFKQEVWVEGKNVWIKTNNMLQKITNQEADKFTYDAILFKDANLLKNGYTCKVLGKQRGQIIMKAISPRGFSSTYYFDENTFLISKIERTENYSGGTIPITETYKEYTDIEGMKMPKVIETITPIYTITTDHNYVLNVEIDDSKFNPETE